MVFLMRSDLIFVKHIMKNKHGQSCNRYRLWRIGKIIETRAQPATLNYILQAGGPLTQSGIKKNILKNTTQFCT